MATETKLVTNRANSKRSTGPRTAAGKAVAKLNAVSHGLRSTAPVVPGERAKDWHDHRAGMLSALAPVGTLETELADRVALLTWRLRRVAAYETSVTFAAVAQANTPANDDDADTNPLAGYLSTFGATTPRTEPTIQKQLAAARDNAASFATMCEAFRNLLAAPPDDRLSGADAFHMLREASAYTPNGDEEVTNIDDEDFLGEVGVPEECRDDPEAWDGWTVGHVLARVTIIAADDEMTAPELLTRAVRQSGATADEERQKAERLEAELAPFVARRAAAEAVARAQAVLLDDAAMNKLLRYETHLNKQLVQTLHLLERLQAARVGNPLVPPLAVDVLVDTGNADALQAG